MKERRRNKLTDQVRDLAARFLEEESNRTSLISVTRVEMSRSGEDVNIFVSVFPTLHETQAFEFISRKGTDFRKFVASHTKTKMIPNFVFLIDEGEKNRQRIEELLRKG
jgi:ribosome-binding factor A